MTTDIVEQYFELRRLKEAVDADRATRTEEENAGIINEYAKAVSQGKKGDDVAQLQLRLYKYGSWYNGSVDGIYGTSTYNAVKAYQSFYLGSSYADGIAGSQTLALIYDSPDSSDERFYGYCTCP